jgi:hypothetical protein
MAAGVAFSDVRFGAYLFVALEACIARFVYDVGALA